MDKFQSLHKDLALLEDATGQINTSRKGHTAIAQALKNISDFIKFSEVEAGKAAAV